METQNGLPFPVAVNTISIQTLDFCQVGPMSEGKYAMNIGDQDLADSSPDMSKKPYAPPELIEHGDIHTLVHRRVINGADGGLPIDNAS